MAMTQTELTRRWRDKNKAHWNAYMREWRKANPEKHRRNAKRTYEKTKNNPDKVRARRRYHLKKTYGLSLERYEQMLVEQGGVCAVCALPETRIITGSFKSLDVDHNHETGEVRGLLCTACNSALGLLSEDTDRIIALLDYVERHRG
jgi:Autographiviridae endonuclease VII